MSLSVACSSCGVKFRALDNAVGRTFKCPTCGNRIALIGTTVSRVDPPASFQKHSEASSNRCEMCGKELKQSEGHIIPSQDSTKRQRSCASCYSEFAKRKAKITPAPTHVHRDLTGKKIRCWFVVGYAGQSGGSHYWRCMCRASLAEKIIAEREILDRKLNVVSEFPDHWEEAGKNPTGWIYGNWTVIGHANTPLKLRKKLGPFWKCRCICGTARDIAQDDLIRRQMVCCGCRPQVEVREELEWKKKLARDGWKKACDAVYRRYRERRFDKKWTRDMERAIRSFQLACVLCGCADHLTIHHVRPVSRGHGLEPGNAVRLCRACNSFIGMKEPSELPPGMALKLETATAQFKEHWESGCATPAACTAIPGEKMSKALDPNFITLLRSIEYDDEAAIHALADWLEERSDPRASAIREVARLEAIAGETWIYFVLDGKRFGPSYPLMKSPGDAEDWLAQHVRKARRHEQSKEVWLRLGLTQALSHTLKQYLGIVNSTGVVATIEEIAQRAKKQVQTIRNRIDSALHLLTFQVRRVPGCPGGAWRPVVGAAPSGRSKLTGRR